MVIWLELSHPSSLSLQFYVLPLIILACSLTHSLLILLLLEEDLLIGKGG